MWKKDVLINAFVYAVFEYQNDSVLSVEKFDYMNCDASNPITAFDNGKSTFNLDRPGNFYFISGTDDHCKNGQKILVDVMHPHSILKSPPPISLSPSLPPEGFPPMAPPPSDDQTLEASSASVLLTTIFMSLFVTFVSVMAFWMCCSGYNGQLVNCFSFVYCFWNLSCLG